MQEIDYNFEQFSQNENPQMPNRPVRQYSRNNPAYLKRKKRYKRRQRLFWSSVAMILLLLIFLIVLLFKSCSADSTLIGKWSIDDITIYEFRENGKGAMLLPSDTYEFTYTVEDKKISIDFVSEFATDKSYTYELKGNKLTLTGEGKFGGVYEMTRMKDSD